MDYADLETITMNILPIYLSIYGILALSHILIQMWFAHQEHRKQKSTNFQNYHSNHTPTVTVVVPCYNEDPRILEKSLKSIAAQQYDARIDAIVVDDGSKNSGEIVHVFDTFRKNTNFQLIQSVKNQGKRIAHKAAFDRAQGEIIVTIDSDTIIEQPYGIVHIVKQFKNPHIGAITGDIRVLNKNENFLTKLISYRYWTAFHQERAAQSLFNVLMCCSGPFSAYRKSLIANIKDKYINQVFLGHRCTFGDDRHLTNLVLEESYKVCFDNRAVAYTTVPSNLKQYVKQQIRWNKSFYREMIWTVKNVHKHHFYMLYDLVMQFILPFLLIVALLAMAYQTIFYDGQYIIEYLLLLIGIACLRALYGIYRTRDIGFIPFIVTYGFMHVSILIPVRLYALTHLHQNDWSTR